MEDKFRGSNICLMNESEEKNGENQKESNI